eukprot:gene33357-43125_t
MLHPLAPQYSYITVTSQPNISSPANEPSELHFNDNLEQHSRLTASNKAHERYTAKQRAQASFAVHSRTLLCQKPFSDEKHIQTEEFVTSSRTSVEAVSSPSMRLASTNPAPHPCAITLRLLLFRWSRMRRPYAMIKPSRYATLLSTSLLHSTTAALRRAAPPHNHQPSASQAANNRCTSSPFTKQTTTALYDHSGPEGSIKPTHHLLVDNRHSDPDTPADIDRSPTSAYLFASDQSALPTLPALRFHMVTVTRSGISNPSLASTLVDHYFVPYEHQSRRMTTAGISPLEARRIPDFLSPKRSKQQHLHPTGIVCIQPERPHTRTPLPAPQNGRVFHSYDPSTGKIASHTIDNCVMIPLYPLPRNSRRIPLMRQTHNPPKSPSTTSPPTSLVPTNKPTSSTRTFGFAASEVEEHSSHTALRPSDPHSLDALIVPPADIA